MRLDLPRPSRRRGFGLTPLIDVVFILLLFFMLASGLQRWQTLTLHGPTAGAAAAGGSRTLWLRIHDDGGLDLNGEPIAAADLSGVLAERLARAPGLEVLVAPADAVPLATLVAVLDHLIAAGVPALRLQ